MSANKNGWVASQAVADRILAEFRDDPNADRTLGFAVEAIRAISAGDVHLVQGIEWYLDNTGHDGADALLKCWALGTVEVGRAVAGVDAAED